MDRKVRIVIQARMASSRLPGKVMATLGNEPLLAHVVQRLQQAAECGRQWETWLATTTQDADDATTALGEKLDVRCIRGPAGDVLSRYILATADLDDHDVVVRATADNPLYCPKRTRMIVAEHFRCSVDYVCVEGLSYVVPEVMTAGALRAVADRADAANCREHVTLYFREHANEFNTLTLPSRWAGLRPEIHLTVDTRSDLTRMRNLFDRLGRSRQPVSLERVYDAWDRGGFSHQVRATPSGDHLAHRAARGTQLTRSAATSHASGCPHPSVGVEPTLERN